ncbi:helix-turn-helix domain-containing protein [Breoghania sp.]|uniref:helix-turn-helix domain-containing protein n=1 Tax=Breoghania sp. TaxID=2065378 RepID=UPI00260EB594|nr:helix-turn-helix domain-containing protein [Breoghania sp.]MDJ0931796.1 helix-turn-helix domain-containing protein [Breoghania sp.]
MTSGHFEISAPGICGGTVQPALMENAMSCHLIQVTVVAVFGIASDMLKAPTRSRAPVAFARQVAMYVAYVSFGLSLTEVGRLFGRDRTTAGYVCRTVEDRRDDPAFDGMVTAIEHVVCACRQAADSRWETLN